MARRKTTGFERVLLLARNLSGVEPGTAYGKPALKRDGKMFACVPSNRSAEANSLVVRISFAMRDELIAAEPDVYYVKDHYVPYPSVLVRLARIHDDALRDLLLSSWQFAGESAKGRKR
jgi:hypothetical protein